MIQAPGIFDKLSHKKLVGGSHPGKKENYPWQVTAESVLCGGLSAKGIKRPRVGADAIAP